ncbi:MAG: hypothetical protein R3F19_18570 [Verrucomicrobiales bacterium]
MKEMLPAEWLFEPGDVTGFRNAINSVISNSDATRAQIAQLQRRIHQSMTVDAFGTLPGPFPNLSSSSPNTTLKLPQLPFVFFDAAGFLFHLSSQSALDIRASPPTLASSGSAAADAAFGFSIRRSRAAIIHIHGPDEDADRCWWKEFVAGYLERQADPQRSSFSDCFDALFSFYGTAEAWQLFPETVDTLHLLQTKGLKLVYFPISIAVSARFLTHWTSATPSPT